MNRKKVRIVTGRCKQCGGPFKRPETTRRLFCKPECRNLYRKLGKHYR